MRYDIEYCNDVGNVKQTNQDSLLIKEAKCIHGDLVMVVVCDGMGGLAKGELASGELVRELSKWFDNSLPLLLLRKDFVLNKLEYNLNRFFKEMNQKILDYGKNNYFNLGTTVSGLIILNSSYMFFHVGDTRIYKITSEKIIQITKDQTFIQREIERGRMDEEDAKNDSRKNILLQCIGASKFVNPQFGYGEIIGDTQFLLCSDGFRHEISNEEIFNSIKNSHNYKEILEYLVEENKSRNEMDNISAILVDCQGGA